MFAFTINSHSFQFGADESLLQMANEVKKCPQRYVFTLHQMLFDTQEPSENGQGGDREEGQWFAKSHFSVQFKIFVIYQALVSNKSPRI
jgi:hypothetical protein